MDKYTATEMAYKHGYEKGYEAGKKFATDNNDGCKWIPVGERLPNENDDVLCCRGNHIGAMMDVYTYKGDNKWEDAYGYWNYGDIEGITHWMPLPEPPNEV